MLKITKNNLIDFLKKFNLDIYETQKGELCLFDANTGEIIAEDGDEDTLVMNINCKLSPMMKIGFEE